MNAITHFELPVSKDSREFYKTTFGWKTQDMPDMDYTMVYTTEVDDKYMPLNPGSINGGFMSVEQNGGTNPILVIDVDSIDEALKKVIDNGGRVIAEKHEVNGMGYYARFADPAGVIMGIWESIKK